MPILERISKCNCESEDKLKKELVEELNNPKESGEPDIVVEKQNSVVSHIYVIWSKWSEFEQLTRSRIIFEAYKTAKGEIEADKITFAMGLTKKEADRLGYS